MKKTIALVLAAMMLLAMAACGNESKEDPIGTTKGQNFENGVAATEAMGETQNQKLENWGVVDDFAVQNEELESATVFFRWPNATGRSAATGEASTQSDGTFVLVDGYSNGISPKGVALKEFFPAYFEQTINAFSNNYGVRYENGKLTADEGEISQINGYEVCKFTGHHTFTFSGQPYDYQYVAYVTTLKSNGAYVYWLVQDETVDQSAGKQMEENALNIIQSIWEE